MKRLVLIAVGTWLSFACGHMTRRNPSAEYLAGINDAIDRVQPRRLPTIVVTWGSNEPDLGQCKTIAGEKVVYVHMGRIIDAAASPGETRALVAEVLIHELGHAEMTCSDRDHLVLPRPSVRNVEQPTLVATPAWTLRPD